MAFMPAKSARSLRNGCSLLCRCFLFAGILSVGLQICGSPTTRLCCVCVSAHGGYLCLASVCFAGVLAVLHPLLTEWWPFSPNVFFHHGVETVGIQPTLQYVSQPINQQLKYNTVRLNYQVPQPIAWQHNILDSPAHLYVSEFINLSRTIQKIIWCLAVYRRKHFANVGRGKHELEDKRGIHCFFSTHLLTVSISSLPISVL